MPVFLHHRHTLLAISHLISFDRVSGVCYGDLVDKKSDFLRGCRYLSSLRHLHRQRF
jgi:hypothetical protein